MSLKSTVALENNVQMLFDDSKPVYFWTFTLPTAIHPYDAARLWKMLCRDLVRSLGMSGVRVFELHPGGHGLHVHLATNDYVRVEHVRPLCEKHGWGRLHVEEWTKEDCCGYMGKYLSKQTKYWRGARLLGIRWWAVFGDVSDKVRVKDVVSRSFFKEIFSMLPAWVVKEVMQVSEPVQGDKKTTSRFNFAKMRLARLIYVIPDFEHGDFDFIWLRQLAWTRSQPMEACPL